MENKKLVLLVDDNEIFRHGMRLILESENFLVEEAGDGREAKECLDAAHFDLVISADGMPDMDGLQLLRLRRPFGRAQLMAAVNGALETKDIIPQPMADAITGTLLKFLKGLS